jgi:hypothetical protein
MPRLDHQLAALTRRWQGVAPMPPALSEAIEELPPTVEARRPMHAELTQRQQATREIQQRAQELGAGVPEASLVPDRHGLLLEANRTAAHLFHLDRPQLRGLPLAMGLAWEKRRAFRTPLAWRQHGAEGREGRIRVQPPSQPAVPVAGHVALAWDGEGRLLGLRHTFPIPQGGAVTITWRAAPAGQVTLTIRDTGMGVPPDLDGNHGESCVFHVVRARTNQLQGTFVVARDSGTCVTLRFPI